MTHIYTHLAIYLFYYDSWDILYCCLNHKSVAFLKKNNISNIEYSFLKIIIFSRHFQTPCTRFSRVFKLFKQGSKNEQNSGITYVFMSCSPFTQGCLKKSLNLTSELHFFFSKIFKDGRMMMTQHLIFSFSKNSLA